MRWIERAPGVIEGQPGEEENQLEMLVRLSNMPLATMKTHRLATWQHMKGNEGWWRYVENYSRGECAHPFVTFVGVVGTGKTHLALAIGWEWIESGKTVFYHQVADFLGAMRDSFRRMGGSDYVRDKVYDETMAFAKNCSLLILDDMGAERSTEWAEEQLDRVVAYRYSNRKPLLVTTNLRLDDLSLRIADRLSEGKVIQLLTLNGQSFRRRKQLSGEILDEPNR